MNKVRISLRNAHFSVSPTNISEEQDEVIQQLREQSERLKEKGLLGARILLLLSSILYAQSHFSFDQGSTFLQAIHPIIGPDGK